MKRYFSAMAVAVAAGALASSAMAANAPVVAKLATPIEGVKKPLAGSAIFLCSGDTCTASNPVAYTSSFSACRELVRIVGPVTSFGLAAKPLEAERLERCNTAAKK